MPTISAMRPPMSAGPIFRQVKEASVAESSGVARFCAGREAAAHTSPAVRDTSAIGRCALIMRRAILSESFDDATERVVSAGGRQTSSDTEVGERHKYV